MVALTAPTRKGERRLLWKIDLLILPLLIMSLGLQYYDKAALGSAAAFGIIEDLKLSTKHNGVVSTNRFATANAMFYYGYIASILPLSIILARLNIKYAAGTIITVWGAIAILTVVCRDYKGLYVERVFLGFVEAGVSPMFVHITALWYKPKEQATRLGVWYSATGIFSMFSGAINYGLGSTGNAHAWKYIYYFCGGLTIAWGLVVFLLLPVSPLQPGPFFNATDREILVRRFEENPHARDRQPFKRDQLIEALLDIRTYIYFLIAAMTYMCNASVTVFGTLIIKSMGYTGLQSVALMIPGGAVTCVTIYFFSYFADKYKNIRTYLLPLSNVPVVVGAITIWTAPWHPTAGPLIGYYLVAAFGAPYVLLLALASANTAGSTKKAATTGAMFTGYVVGNIAASYTVIASEAKKKYPSTWITVIVAMGVSSIASLVLRFLLVRENKRRDALEAQNSSVEGSPTLNQAGGVAPAYKVNSRQHEQEKSAALGLEVDVDAQAPPINIDEYADLTDKQIPEFRYSL